MLRKRDLIYLGIDQVQKCFENQVFFCSFARERERETKKLSFSKLPPFTVTHSCGSSLQYGGWVITCALSSFALNSTPFRFERCPSWGSARFVRACVCAWVCVCVLNVIVSFLNANAIGQILPETLGEMATIGSLPRCAETYQNHWHFNRIVERKNDFPTSNRKRCRRTSCRNSYWKKLTSARNQVIRWF